MRLRLTGRSTLDARRVIDAFLDPAHPTAGAYASHVDADKVVVTGHSFGGFTTIAVATGFTNDLGTTPVDKRVKAIMPMQRLRCCRDDESERGRLRRSLSRKAREYGLESVWKEPGWIMAP